MLKLQNIKTIVLILSIGLILAANAFAQTTAFTYQGRFTDSTVPQPTNGTYNMRFALYDAVSGGNQVGLTVDIPVVHVTNGIFTVSLDYTAASFDGTTRFLEITVGNIVLSPRQEITNAPYAILAQNALRANQAINSDQLGGINADQYVTGQVVRSVNNLTGNLILTAGSNITITPVGNTLTIASTGGGNGINNQTSLQAGANFNIDGTGAANIFSAMTQFNIGSNRVLSVGGGNIFAGVNAGNSNTTGGDNAFVGTNAGLSNLTGFNNSFFGTDAGRSNTANDNSFFGRSAGFANTTGTRNVFFGEDAGRFNLTGSGNSFIGTQAGQNNTTGANNTIIGDSANVGSGILTFATALGSGAVVSTNNTVVLGRTLDTVVAPNLLQVAALGVGGSLALCRNASNQISTCTLAAFGGSFIENSTAQQPTSNFNISGAGTVGGLFSANVVSSTTTYRIGGVNVFSTPNTTSVVAGQSSNFTLTGSNSAFFGYKAGQTANSFSQANTFIGSESGELTTSGGNNTFVGTNAGFFNTTGSLNSFFGSSAGKSNTTANANSFFGYETGLLNSTGTQNSFFGFQAGRASQTVGDNSFFGYQAGTLTTGGGNSFFGSLAGGGNTNGSNNTFVGNKSGETNTSGTNNTFLGYNSGSNTGNSNTFLGVGSGGAGSSNTFVGINSNGTGSSNTVIGSNTDGTGNFSTVLGAGASSVGNDNTAIGSGASVEKFDPSSSAPTFATAIGAGAVANLSNSVVLGRNNDFVKVPGQLVVSGDVSAQDLNAQTLTITGGLVKLTTLIVPTNTGNKPLCRNANSFMTLCPNLTDNFSLVSKEQTAQIETQSSQIKEQQMNIAAQAEQIKQMKTQIEALKQIVCAMNPAAGICGK
jgi:hypothetical protein